MNTKLFPLLFLVFWSGLSFGSKNLPHFPAQEHEDSAQIRQLVISWNDAINQNQASKLADLYADEVVYYLDKFPRKYCVDKKIKSLNSTPGFTQKVTLIKLSYFTEGYRQQVCATFHKEYASKAGNGSARGLLYFEKFGNNWKIIKETDEASEKKRLNQMKTTLQRGEYYFQSEEEEYTSDEEDEEDLPADGQTGHYLHLKIGDRIEGNYGFYSLAFRSSFSYLITEGTQKNGILSVSGIIDPENPNAADADISKEFSMEFKVNENELLDPADQNPPLYLDQTTLAKGKYSFSDELTGKFKLFLNIENEISGSYQYYHKTSGSTSCYRIAQGKIENGSLKLWLIFEKESGNAKAPGKDLELRLRIVNKKGTSPSLYHLDEDNGEYLPSLILNKDR